MATEYFVKLWDNNIIQLGIWQTVYMTALTTIFAYLIGLPLGVILWATDKDGLAAPTRASTPCSALS